MSENNKLDTVLTEQHKNALKLVNPLNSANINNSYSPPSNIPGADLEKTVFLVMSGLTKTCKTTLLEGLKAHNLVSELESYTKIPLVEIEALEKEILDFYNKLKKASDLQTLKAYETRIAELRESYIKVLQQLGDLHGLQTSTDYVDLSKSEYNVIRAKKEELEQICANAGRVVGDESAIPNKSKIYAFHLDGSSSNKLTELSAMHNIPIIYVHTNAEAREIKRRLNPNGLTNKEKKMNNSVYLEEAKKKSYRLKNFQSYYKKYRRKFEPKKPNILLDTCDTPNIMYAQRLLVDFTRFVVENPCALDNVNRNYLENKLSHIVDTELLREGEKGFALECLSDKFLKYMESRKDGKKLMPFLSDTTVEYHTNLETHSIDVIFSPLRRKGKIKNILPSLLMINSPNYEPERKNKDDCVLHLSLNTCYNTYFDHNGGFNHNSKNKKLYFLNVYCK